MKIDEEKLNAAIAQLQSWKYQPELTEKLDKLHKSSDDLNLTILYEIILWKLNRFTPFAPDLIENLKNISNIDDPSCEESKKILTELLETQGIGLPMASTILRFLNPNIFQIIDDRVYRFLYPKDQDKWNDKIPKYISGTNQEKIEIYSSYLNDLKKACKNYKVEFAVADRVFYLYDKLSGNKVGAGRNQQK